MVWSAGAHTAVVGVDMLPELLHGAQTNHGPTAEPERCHGPELLMQADEELVQTASVHDVLQVSVPADIIWVIIPLFEVMTLKTMMSTYFSSVGLRPGTPEALLDD